MPLTQLHLADSATLQAGSQRLSDSTYQMTALSDLKGWGPLERLFMPVVGE